MCILQSCISFQKKYTTTIHKIDHCTCLYLSNISKIRPVYSVLADWIITLKKKCGEKSKYFEKCPRKMLKMILLARTLQCKIRFKNISSESTTLLSILIFFTKTLPYILANQWKSLTSILIWNALKVKMLDPSHLACDNSKYIQMMNSTENQYMC